LKTTDKIDFGKPSEKHEFSVQMEWLVSKFYNLSGRDCDLLRVKSGIDYGLNELKDSEHVPENMSINASKLLALIFGYIDGFTIEYMHSPDPARIPFFVCSPEGLLYIVSDFDSSRLWRLEAYNQQPKFLNSIENFSIFRPKINRIGEHESKKARKVYDLFKREFFLNKSTFMEVIFASIMVNLLALGTGLYSMQVYDRVIPTQGISTLLVLTGGVILAIVFEFLVKLLRSSLMRQTILKMDTQLSRTTFAQLLNVRLDQMPQSVGSLSAQLRGYEMIRSFIASTTIYVIVDVPFGLIYIFLVGVIGSPVASLVPLTFLIISLIFGFMMRSQATTHANQAIDNANEKTGLLVETIEGAETIKSGSSSWRVLSKWIDVSEKTIFHDMTLKAINERSTYFSALFQQVSSIGLVAVGAYLTTTGEMTMGALIACTILSGRALSPMSQIPALMVQAASAKAALERLETFFGLEVDNQDVDRPLRLDMLKGKYFLEGVKFNYRGSPEALTIDNLFIKPGEKVGVIGPVGAGKSTLLRLLTGMYKPNAGKVFVDDLDIAHLSRGILANKIGYLQQEHRLFSGTLRENLLIGMVDPGDEFIKSVAQSTGLLEAISRNPKGLDMLISEGGKGMSGGQKQLVALTRLLMTDSTIWLLDEPTASMDATTETRCLDSLKQKIKLEHTLVLVTHKIPLLNMIDRLICVVNHKVVLDGPRDEILKKLASSIK